MHSDKEILIGFLCPFQGVFLMKQHIVMMDDRRSLRGNNPVGIRRSFVTSVVGCLIKKKEDF